MTDEQKGMAVSLFWHKNGAIVAALAKPGDVCKATEKKLRSALKDHEYRFESFFKRTIGGKDAYGFRHFYLRQGEDQVSEVTLFMRGRVCYTLYCYTSVERQQENLPALYDIIDGIAFS